MKKRYILIEFLLVFLFLVLPPLFVKASSGISKTLTFTPAAAVQLLVAVFLQMHFVYFLRPANNASSVNSAKKAGRIFTVSFWWSITLGSLMLIFALMQTLSFFIEQNAHHTMQSVTSVFAWISVTVSVAIAAFYEEALYRQFLPEVSAILLVGKINKKIFFHFIEVLVILIFAFSHRYLGFIPVLNAFACGAVLRLCYRKTGSIWTGALAHFTYNMTLIIFSQIID